MTWRKHVIRLEMNGTVPDRPGWAGPGPEIAWYPTDGVRRRFTRRGAIWACRELNHFEWSTYRELERRWSFEGVVHGYHTSIEDPMGMMA